MDLRRTSRRASMVSCNGLCESCCLAAAIAVGPDWPCPGTQRFRGGMLNIPTDLLRTLVAVVDLRSFTKAAQSLGITQPAVSAQIKRLQYLLGYELLDKSAPGVSLTPRGEMVVTQSRRMLSINDQIAQLGGGQLTAQTVRVAMPGDFAGTRIPATLAR